MCQYCSISHGRYRYFGGEIVSDENAPKTPEKLKTSAVIIVLILIIMTVINNNDSH